MPIDPSVAQGIQIPQQEDFLSRYGKIAQVSNLQLQNEQARKEQELNAQLRAYLPTVEDFDAPDVQTKLSTFGKPGIEIRKSISDARTSELGRDEKEQDLLKKDLLNSIDVLSRYVKTPEQALQYTEATYNNPRLRSLLEANGMTKEAAFADLNQHVSTGKFNDWLIRGVQGGDAFKKSFIERNLGDRSEITSYSQVGGAETVPGSERTIGTSPNRPQNNTYVDLGGKNASEFGKTLARTNAKSFATLDEAAQNAQVDVDTSERILSVLQKNPIVGTGAGFRLGWEKALNLLGVPNNDVIADTEALASDLASSTLGRIKTSGLGTGQGFTDKDLNFLKQAAAGTLEMSSQNLAHLADLNRRAAVRTVERYNQRAGRLKEGALENTTSPESYEIPKVNTKLGAPKSSTPMPAAVRKAISKERWDALPESGKLQMIKKYGR